MKKSRGAPIMQLFSSQWQQYVFLELMKRNKRFNSLTVLVTGNVCTVFGRAGVEDDTRRPETAENDAVQRPWSVHLINHHHELADGGLWTANAVARIDNLEFLADVIPPTVPFKQIREKKNKAAKDAEVGQPQLMMTGVQKILPIGAPNGSKRSGNGKAKSKTTTPETDTPTSYKIAEEDVGNMVGDSGVEKPLPSGLERFLFDKSKNHDGEAS